MFIRISHTPRNALRTIACFALVAGFLTVWSPLILAAPGAHGPNGEHLDAPSGATAGTVPERPRFEMQSDLFEVVGMLNAGELQIFINRFATNEPVLNAAVELETGALKAQAIFHEDLGDYAVADQAVLDALRAEGDHAIVLTILAGEDADLLDATLTTPATLSEHAHGLPGWTWITGILLAIGGIALVAVRSLRTARPARLAQ